MEPTTSIKSSVPFPSTSTDIVILPPLDVKESIKVARELLGHVTTTILDPWYNKYLPNGFDLIAWLTWYYKNCPCGLPLCNGGPRGRGSRVVARGGVCTESVLACVRGPEGVGPRSRLSPAKRTTGGVLS